MSNFNICFSCMSPLEKAFDICPKCGASCGIENDLHQLPSGTILAGKYLVGRVLGQGGFGITYIGYELNLDIKVAIKEYFPQGVVTRLQTGRNTVTAPTGSGHVWFTKSRERFLGEAKTLAKFGYLGNIVNVRDYFTENGTAYIVMDYVEGKTAKEHAKENGGKLPANKVLEWLYPIMESLGEIHNSSLLHRDIAPDNIMIRSKDDKAVLLDFGAARQVSAAGEYSNTVNVKHGYAPMEQYRTHGNQGPWTDVYAICATIYRLTTGQIPPQAIDRASGEDELVPPNKLGAGLNVGQQAAIMKGLSMDIKDRQQSMGELLRELKSKRPVMPVSGIANAAAQKKSTAVKKPATSDNNSKAINADESIGNTSGRKTKLCRKCGGEIDPETKKCKNCGKTAKKMKRIFRITCFALFLLMFTMLLCTALLPLLISLLLFILYIFNYCCAVSALNKGHFVKSKKHFDRLLVARLLFPEEYRYVEAAALMQNGDCYSAYTKFSNLAVPVSSETMCILKERMYAEAQELYRKGDLSSAKRSFDIIGADYKQSGDYLFLISLKTGTSKNKDINRLTALAGFEDASKLILKSADATEKFLTQMGK